MGFDPVSQTIRQFPSELRLGLPTLLVSALLVASFGAPRASAQGFLITELHAPYSTGATTPFGINATGDVVGGFTAANGATKGFLYAGGKYTVLNGPPGTDGFARALGINSASPNVIVGDYKTSDNRYHGFMYESGHYTNFDYNSTTSSGIFGINDTKDIVGDFGNSAPEGFAVINGKRHAFYGKGTDSTYAYAINDSDDVVGVYFDSSGLKHGFLRAPSGAITQIAFPGAVQTECDGINNTDEITGTYTNTAGLTYGFTYKKGKYASTDFASTAGVNASGGYVGYYWGVDGAPAGYVAIPQSFALSKVEIPSEYSKYYSIINSINKAGVMVGQYVDAAGNSHGMRIEKNGTVTTIDNPDGVQTVLFYINSSGEIVGDAFDSQGNPHGFKWVDGNFTSIPGPSDALSSDATGINDQGWIAGDYFGTDRTHHGFILKGSTYKVLNEPGATTTFTAGINNAGDVVLAWGDAKGYTQSSLYNGTKYISIDVPGAAQNLAASINTAGDIVYRVFDPYSVGHAALKKGNDYYIFDFPGGVNSGALGINDNGEIVGFYYSSAKSKVPLLYEGME
jgi:probable HAF family extracellular repeat protein